MKENTNQEIPDHIIMSLAKMLLPEIQKFYETDEGKECFKEYKESSDKDITDL